MSVPSASQVDDMNNERIADRNIPSAKLQPYFSQRSTSTKYTKFMDASPPPSNAVPLQTFPNYSPADAFNPGNRAAPWSGFASSIDIESDIRNQFYALQRCPQASHVPSAGSDLYTLQSFSHPEKTNVQSHPLLFTQDKLERFNPNVTNSSRGMFNNHTRQDIKNVKL